MKTFAALFRGINVGGHGILPMKDLREVLAGLGLQNVKTYLQSGNAVFQSSTGDARELRHAISNAIEERFQFAPKVWVLTLEELRAAVAANPFPEGEDDPKSVHLFFLRSLPDDPDIARLETLRSDSERFELSGAVFYLHAPDGIGRSKLAANAEKALGVAATGRNWRSVGAIMAIALEMTA